MKISLPMKISRIMLNVVLGRFITPGHYLRHWPPLYWSLAPTPPPPHPVTANCKKISAYKLTGGGGGGAPNTCLVGQKFIVN